MAKKLKILSCVTDVPRFHWETDVFLGNIQEYGLLKDVTVLIFQQRHFFMNDFSPEWKRLEDKYPEAEFVYYKDVTNITRICTIFNYIPLFRLYVLQEYFKKYPELEKETIVYLDSDIIFTKEIDWKKYTEDNVNYVSWTGNPERTDNYLWQPYFDGKIAQVRPDRLEAYKKIDVLGKVANICGTTREVVTQNNLNIGGAQYILKNINSQFWTDCFNASCEVKLYLEDVNRNYMIGDTPLEKQNNGIQAWCADMMALLFTLMKNKAEIRAPKELDFAWSTDRIERLNSVLFCHNAGVTSDAKIRVAFEKNPDGSKKEIEGPLFYKGKYNNRYPEQDLEELEAIYNNEVNKGFCNNYYLGQIIKTIKTNKKQ